MAERQYKPKAHIILDTETLSTSRRAGVVELAALGQFGATGMPKSFYVAIKPTQYDELKQFDVNMDTITWHNEQNPGHLAKLDAEGVSLQEAMNQFLAWIGQFTEPYELHMWSQGKDFDFPILEWALQQCGYEPPWKFRNVHCIRDLLFLNPRSRIGGAKKAAHTAMADTEWAHAQWRKIIADSSWYGRLFN
ncbi:hypothetical protein D3C80_129280 [compost metagenome]